MFHALFAREFTGQDGRIRGGDAHNFITRFDLLIYQWQSRCQKDDFARREPSVEIVHDDGRNESLSQTSGQ